VLRGQAPLALAPMAYLRATTVWGQIVHFLAINITNFPVPLNCFVPLQQLASESSTGRERGRVYMNEGDLIEVEWQASFYELKQYGRLLVVKKRKNPWGSVLGGDGA